MYRAATWLLVVVVLASSLAALFGTAAASSPTYTLAGFVDQPGGPSAAPVPAGVTVDLVSRATGAVYAATTGSGGQFKFTTASTSGGLVPGYWGLYVPVAANSPISGCRPYHCAVLPQNQTPVYAFYSAHVLAHPGAPQVITNVAVVPYNATLLGTVMQSSSPVAGATVKLLAPAYAGLALISNTSNATGVYNLSVPFGTWVLQASHSSGSNYYSNSTQVHIVSTTPPNVNPVLKGYAISGRILSSLTHGYVTVGGNATLFDPSHQYIYTTTTPTGGYYAFASYPSNFVTVGTNEQFYVLLSSVGFQTDWYPLNVSTATPVLKTVTVAPITGAQRGQFHSTLDFSGVSPVTGTGSLAVTTDVNLGNDSAVPGLPNASVGQLWAQLGLDFNHALGFNGATSNAALKTWLADQGPFFPAVQAGTTVNGTAFLGPKVAQGLTNFTFTSGCTTSCGPSSSKTLNYTWSNSYRLNGTIAKNASAYSIAFHFAHPSTGANVYNYTVKLPAGYTLSAGTTAPANTSLIGVGPTGTWTRFTLVSKVAPSPSATATFSIVRIANLTARLSVTSSNAFFSSANVLNSSHNNYTVVLGQHENATYSAAPTTYPNGQNGTRFLWTWGDGSNTSLANVTTNHTYAAPNGSLPYHGTLEVTGSSGSTNKTTFYVWIVTSTPTAGIASNATSAENRTAGGVPFLYVNWTRTLHFNATATQLTSPNVLAIASYSLKARSFTSSANFTAAKSGKPLANWTVAFGANTTSNKTAPGHGVYVNFATVHIGGNPSGVTGWGWIYNLTLTVWSVIGTTSTAHLTILVNDTEPPVPVLALQSATGKTLSGSSVVEGPHHYVVLKLSGTGSSDFGNGSIVSYSWLVSNPGNKSFANVTYHNLTAKPLPQVKLYPKTTNYKIKLTVQDKNGNDANTTRTLEVADNTTLRPIMQANNLTGPTSLNAGTRYTYYVNVTVGGGAKAIAQNVTVEFYTQSASGTGGKSFIGGSPGSVTFYGYSNSSKNATVNSTVLATGKIATLHHGKTVRAVLSWNPSKSGSFTLYAWVRATNGYVNNSSVSYASTAITVHANPTTQLLEYGGIAAGVVIVLGALVIFWRRRTRRGGPAAKPSAGRSGLERTARRPDDDDEE